MQCGVHSRAVLQVDLVGKQRLPDADAPLALPGRVCETGFYHSPISLPPACIWQSTVYAHICLPLPFVSHLAKSPSMKRCFFNINTSEQRILSALVECFT